MLGEKAKRDDPADQESTDQAVEKRYQPPGDQSVPGPEGEGESKATCDLCLQRSVGASLEKDLSLTCALQGLRLQPFFVRPISGSTILQVKSLLLVCEAQKHHVLLIRRLS
jgi:hypothetical protein